jgi:glycosyltransferase involved in cell wall biosynthesis
VLLKGNLNTFRIFSDVALLNVKRTRVIVSVINDLATDQRVKKVCDTLYRNGYDILLIGRKLKDSLPVNDRPYKVMRMKLLFTHGALFYTCFNIRLFFVLLFVRGEIFHSNDLDTLLANRLAARLRRKPLVYDSHELFTEVPELMNRPGVRKVWLRIERGIFPKLKYVFTVNESIAEIYRKKYKVDLLVLRNVPSKAMHIEQTERQQFGLDESKKVLILQGSGINIDRGAEELLEAMKLIENVVLIIAGGGDVIGKLKLESEHPLLKGKVMFFDKMPHQELMKLTRCADCGITLDKDTNLNYRYSLPNKLFDYIHAGIPVLASKLPEIEKIINKYQIGVIVESHDYQVIAQNIQEIVFNVPKSHWTNALERASNELSWEHEEQKLLNIYEQIKR